MNRNFIILLLTIFVIGILYYYIRYEGFGDSETCLDVNFNTDDKYKPYNQVFSKVYKNDKIFTDKKFLTFMNSDFNDPHIMAISNFLALRDSINSKATKDYQHYVITHKMMVSFNSDIDKYLEINFNNFENIPIIKIIYTHENKKLNIENKLIDPSTNELTLNNGFSNSIEFIITVLKRNKIISNQFSFVINGNMYCYNLPEGLENHFYNNLKNITVYPSTTNTNNYFTIRHTCTGEIYAAYMDSKIKSRRIPTGSSDYTIKGTVDKKFNLLMPNTPNGYYPLGSYLINNIDPRNKTNNHPNGPLILEDGDYVKPSTGYINKWDNKGTLTKQEKLINMFRKDRDKVTNYPPRLASYIYTLLNASDRKINIRGTNYNFKALSGPVIIGEPGNSQINPPVALVREDCLSPHPNNIKLLWDSKNTNTSKEGSIWTYNNNNSYSSFTLGHPGDYLAVFQTGYKSPSPQLKWIIKEECMTIQPQLLTNEEKQSIDVLVNDRANYYYSIIKDKKERSDSMINPNLEKIIKENNEKINNINIMVNNSKSIYDLDYQTNKGLYNMQDKYNSRYDFLNLLNTQLNPIKDNEINTYTNNGSKINQISSSIDNSLYMPSDLLKESNTKFISETGNTNNLIQQYGLQRQNENILRVIGEQISK